MNCKCPAHKQGEVEASRVVLDEAIKAETKKELLKRLDHIQQLAKEKEFKEINRLLQNGYV